HGAGNEVVILFEGHSEVQIPYHRDQLVERSRLAQALRPAHTPVVGQVIANSPARDAGLQVGDSLVAIDGTVIRWWPEAVAMIEAAPGGEVTLDVVRDGQTVTLRATPRATPVNPADSSAGVVGKLGVTERVPTVSERYSVPGAVVAGGKATWTA